MGQVRPQPQLPAFAKKDRGWQQHDKPIQRDKAGFARGDCRRISAMGVDQVIGKGQRPQIPDVENFDPFAMQMRGLRQTPCHIRHGRGPQARRHIIARQIDGKDMHTTMFRRGDMQALRHARADARFRASRSIAAIRTATPIST